jgi:hypothetical protein
MIPFPSDILLLIQSLSGELLSLEADYFCTHLDSVPGAISILLLIQSLPADNKPSRLTNDSVPRAISAFDSVPIWRITKPRG